MDTLNVKLYIVCFLDAVSLGFIVPILSTHIFTLGGTHTILGLLATFHFLFQSLSGPLIRTLKQSYGSKETLLFTLVVNFMTYTLLGLTTSCTVVIILRLIYAAFNQTQTVCKSFSSEFNPSEKQELVNNVMNALSVAGFIIGPIIGGYVYEFKDGFYYSTMLSALAYLLSTIIATLLPKTSKDKNERTSLSFKLNENYNHCSTIIKNVDFKQHWDSILLKALYHSSFTIFFIKFALLLRVNYDISSTTIGFTYAYQNILTFLTQFLVVLMNPIQKEFTSISFTVSLLSIMTSFIGLCFAPTYDMYLLSFIPMIYSHTLVNNNWKKVYNLRSTAPDSIEAFDDIIVKLVSIFVPAIFGILCDLYGYRSLQAIVILPLLLSVAVSVLPKLEYGEPVKKE